MKEFFPEVKRVQFEGKESRNPLAFRYYNPEQVVGDKTMAEHLRFSVAYWHAITGDGKDMFGSGSAIRPWDDLKDPMEVAKARAYACFEFMEKMQIQYFCFHDTDLAPEGASLRETFKNIDEIVEILKELMAKTGRKLLWGTSNLFGHPRFMHGAATSPDPKVFAYAAARVKRAMEITKELGGENYVFWGGREGYETLLNTDMKLELDNLARFLHMAVDYAKEIGFTGQLLIEPKPKEPTKHQYDFDTATVIGFLKTYGLDEHFKINIEANHATLAGHTFQHELRVARINGMLGSVDANQGDELLGWDTDQFSTNVYATTLAMYEILLNGGLAPGGLNFDAKVRRGSYEPIDLFYGHIAGMDAFAKGLLVAQRLVESGELEQFISNRYAGYRTGIGAKIVNGEVGFKELYEYALDNDQITLKSGRQEMLENILNRYILD
ncbi:MAG: xylose isomerase [Bacillota bacterium]|jgi:xylose isomerase|nr:xylose isomerase [Bacillota bacterium]HOB90976.1 xylose isomerase [Bacillota bacterium]HPZ54102.1 xylose isomerase [Bacillota bacterium]HQD18511.1 xylose isomerase [Bacillota bacterium]